MFTASVFVIAFALGWFGPLIYAFFKGLWLYLLHREEFDRRLARSKNANKAQATMERALRDARTRMLKVKEAKSLHMTQKICSRGVDKIDAALAQFMELSNHG